MCHPACGCLARVTCIHRMYAIITAHVVRTLRPASYLTSQRTSYLLSKSPFSCQIDTLLAVQIAFICILYPSVMISYFGQSAWLLKHPEGYATSFFGAIPWGDGFFYFYFVVAVLAACVASQTMISAAYSIVRQSMALRCFPRMKVIHTSKRVSQLQALSCLLMCMAAAAASMHLCCR